MSGLLDMITTHCFGTFTIISFLFGNQIFLSFFLEFKSSGNKFLSLFWISTHLGVNFFF